MVKLFTSPVNIFDMSNGLVTFLSDSPLKLNNICGITINPMIGADISKFAINNNLRNLK